MNDGTDSTTLATESDNVSDMQENAMTDATADISSAASTETAPAAEARPIPVQRINRRVYGAHKVYNTCITVGAFVYLAPPAIAGNYDKKSTARLDFVVSGVGADAIVLDLDGNEWICAGENGGCGPRLSALPAEHREGFKKIWHSMSFSDRIAVIRRLVPAKASK